MKKFAFWYAYFDTIFTRKRPIPNATLVSMIPPTTELWPQQCALPELSQCFSQLQSFILEEKNWSESICTIDQLNCIESDVTNVLVLLQIQKIYIINFWSSKRRVEASVAHLYTILQIFVGSIIPYHNMTLFQCKAANKLSVKVVNLQNLFKSIMAKINSICAYFSDSFFDEEDAILRNFFQNFVAFMKIIPKVKKAKMFHISELLKYVLIVNTLEIANGQSRYRRTTVQKPKGNWNKAQKNKEINKKYKSLQSFRNKISSFNGYIIANRRRLESCHHRDLSTQENSDHYTKTKNLLRFIFPSWIRRHSIKHRKQSLPKLNIEPIAKAVKGKSNSQFRRNSPSQQKSTSKYRKASATKSRLLVKSNSLIDSHNWSPLKSGLKKIISSDRIQPINQTRFDEDQENNIVEITSSLMHVKEKKHSHILVEKRLSNTLCIDDLTCEKDTLKITELFKDYAIINELERIILM